MKKFNITLLSLLTFSISYANVNSSFIVNSQRNNTSPYGKLIIGGDYRFAIDNLNYNLANGKTAQNDALLTNRLWLTFSYKPHQNIDFFAKLAYNKVFGQPRIQNNQAPFDDFDWLGSTTATDNQFRVKEAFINYRNSTLFGEILPWDFGVGRRPTTYTKLLNFRDDQASSNPIGHLVSSEFDGGHLGFKLEPLTGIQGASLSLAMGRGLSSVTPSLSSTPNAQFEHNINMFSINIVPYSSKSIYTKLQVLKATNLLDITNGGYDQFGTFNQKNVNLNFQRVGDILLASYMFLYTVEKYDTKLFASVAMSQTDPIEGKTMLGNPNQKIGTSFWVGVQTPSPLTKNGHWGAEYNHGSKFWRPVTYAEDTVVGSKIATRGDAYEAYFTEEITQGLTFQIRYTYLDYKFSGSNGFFGDQTGNSVEISDISDNPQASKSDVAGAMVENAQDVRVYLRYRF